MWSLPHTESKPSSSQSSAVGRMSAGVANGTGYIIPSMQVGMWTPNLTAAPRSWRATGSIHMRETRANRAGRRVPARRRSHAMVEWAPRPMTTARGFERSGAPRSVRLRGASAALLLLPPLLLAWLGWRQRWVSEDAFILLRVVQNLLGGDGPV